MSKNARKIGASLNETVHLFNKILGLYHTICSQTRYPRISLINKKETLEQ